MHWLHTRTYTNVALTLLILILGTLAAQPYFGLPEAQAQRSALRADAGEDSGRPQLGPDADQTAAIREIAQANERIAQALTQMAQSQKDMARSFSTISSVMQR